MKILHVSDTHLGYSAYRKTTENGLNQREIDTYKAFKEFISYAIKTKPDLILHAGDLFDSVRPNNRAITTAVKEINKLSKAKIPFIIIAGNHEHPKLRETGHIFSIFDHMENIYPFYNGRYETITFTIKSEKNVIHVLPQCDINEQFNIELKKLKPDKKADHNIVISHGSVIGIKNFSMNEFNEQIIPTNIIQREFDYIALGHYHTFTKIAENAFYSGSTEHFTFADAGDRKGFIELEIKKNKVFHTFIELKNRTMIDLKPIKCSNIKIDEIMKKIKETVSEIQPKEKIIRITLDEIPSQVYRSIDLREIKKYSNEAIHFEIQSNIKKDSKIKLQTSSKIDALVNEFKIFLESQDYNEKKILLDLGLSYIEKIQDKDEGK